MRPGPRSRSWRRDLVAAALWAVAVIPAAMGFWLVAGSVAGVRPDQIDTLVMASLLALGLATLLQVAFGFRLPMYEGPAAAYLASITVISAEGYHSLAAVTGGLLAAGVFVALLGVVGADRLIARAFTPLVGNVFVMTVTLAIAPATISAQSARRMGCPARARRGRRRSSWSAVALFVRRWQRLVPYSLLAALVAGTATYFVLAGWPHVDIGGGLAAAAAVPLGRSARQLRGDRAVSAGGRAGRVQHDRVREGVGGGPLDPDPRRRSAQLVLHARRRPGCRGGVRQPRRDGLAAGLGGDRATAGPPRPRAARARRTAGAERWRSCVR